MSFLTGVRDATAASRISATLLAAGAALFLASCPAQASEPYNTVGIGAGVVHQQVRDDVLAPLRWDGLGGVLEFSYDRVSGTRRHHAELSIPVVRVSNRYGAGGYTTGLGASYGHLSTLGRELAGGMISAGALLDWSLCLQYYEDWDDEHLYWLNAYEFGPWATWSRPLGNGRRVDVGIDVPLAALTSRVPSHHFYKLDPLEDIGFLFSRPNEDLSFSTLNEYFAVTLRCDYAREPGQGRPFGVSLVLDYRTHSEPERVQVITATVLFRGLFNPGYNKEGHR